MRTSSTSRARQSSAMTLTTRESSSRTWTRSITPKSSFRLNWISRVRASSTAPWCTITTRLLCTTNNTRNSHIRMSKWASSSRMESYMISKRNWTNSHTQSCKINLRMISDKWHNSQYSTIIWLSMTSWIILNRSKANKSNSPASIKFKGTYCKTILFWMTTNIQIKSNGAKNKCKTNIKI